MGWVASMHVPQYHTIVTGILVPHLPTGPPPRYAIARLLELASTSCSRRCHSDCAIDRLDDEIFNIVVDIDAVAEGAECQLGARYSGFKLG